MKKIYQAPALEIELYGLDANIAANCALNVTSGPAYGTHEACDGFDFGDVISLFSAKTSFYDDTDGSGGSVCTCYYTAGNEGYFTS